MRFILYLIILLAVLFALISPVHGVVPIPIPYPNAIEVDRLTTIQFLDATVTLPACTSWHWVFGDTGETSNLQTPTHTFWKGDENVTVTFSCTSPGGTGTNYTYVKVDEIYRAKATTTIEAEPTQGYDAIMEAIGNRSTNATMPSYLTMMTATLSPYTYVFGNVALVIIFLIPFLMMWLMQRNLTIPGVIGLVLGGSIYLRLPPEYQIVATAFIALSVVAIAYSLLEPK